MKPSFPGAERTPVAWPAAGVDEATAPGPHRPVDETPDEPPGRADGSPADLLSFSGPACPRPADPLCGSTVNTMLAIYRAKYRLDVGTVVFQAHKAKAAEVRAWCDGMRPGECGFLLACTSRGVHTFVLAVGRSGDGKPRCLMVDSAGPCMGSVKLALQKEFGQQVYITPAIQGMQARGCMVFAMRFLLMSRCADLGARVLETMTAFEQRGEYAGDRQLQPGDMLPLAGWLAATRERPVVNSSDVLPMLPLDNGGRHANWTLAEFFNRRGGRLATELRQLYDEVDSLVQSPATATIPESGRAYLQHRFLRHLPV